MTAVAAPPERRRRTAAVVWILLAVLVVAVGALGAWLSALGQYAQREALDPEAHAPEGARAIVEVLRDHSVAVDVVRSLDEVPAALAVSGTTLVVTGSILLDDDVLQRLASDATTLVVLDPDARTLDLLFDGSEPRTGGYVSEAAAARCDLAVALQADEITPGAQYLARGDAVGCYGDETGWGLLALGDDGSRRYAIDGTAILDNEHLAEGAHAALAVALLGGADRLVWYMPSVTDPALAGGGTLGDATPDWVTPAIVLLAVAALVAMVWRGRRFGPLVAETLPVTVRASETTAGRARLYARARDPLHAADQLRIATAGRLARVLALGPAATTEAIADAAAGRLGADRRAVRAVLLDDVPASDRDLVDLAARLRHLEAAVRAAVTPGGTRP